MLKKLLSISLCLALLQFGFTQQAQAQKTSTGTYYNNAVGIRLDFGSGGSEFGFSGKHFFTQNHAGEAQLLFGSSVTYLGLEYQYHAPLKKHKDCNGMPVWVRCLLFIPAVRISSSGR